MNSQVTKHSITISYRKTTENQTLFAVKGFLNPKTNASYPRPGHWSPAATSCSLHVLRTLLTTPRVQQGRWARERRTFTTPSSSHLENGANNPPHGTSGV